MALSKSEIEREVERLGPFHHGIDLPHGLHTQPDGLSRGQGELNRVRDIQLGAWSALLELFGGSLEGKRVLDVGCNCGGFSVQAARDGAQHVLGVDVVDRYIEQANFVKRALDLDEVEFRRASIEELDREDVGSFDVTLNFGLLFHLENPVLAMRRLAAVTSHAMIVDTNVDGSGGGASWRMKVIGGPNPDNPSTSLWRSEEGTAQFIPTEAAVEKLLQLLGFASVTRLDPHPDQAPRYHKGTRMTFVAVRSGDGAPSHLFGRAASRPGRRRVEPRSGRQPVLRRLARRVQRLRSRS
jgi:2-polyprenyl-3-methyl-5-hydroxy-6-metoxy-1,4-benzoquinol methylase